MNKRRLFYSLPIILLLIVAVAGWFVTDYLGNKARHEIIGESQASALVISIYVSSTLTNIERAVKSLAGSPWIVPALLSKGAQDACQSTLNVEEVSNNGMDSDSEKMKIYRVIGQEKTVAL